LLRIDVSLLIEVLLYGAERRIMLAVHSTGLAEFVQNGTPLWPGTGNGL